MVRLFVDVERNVVRLVEWHMCSSRHIGRHIKEVKDFFVGFDCDFKAMLAEDTAKVLFNLFCMTGRGLVYAKTVVALQAKIVAMCVSNVLEANATNCSNSFRIS